MTRNDVALDEAIAARFGTAPAVDASIERRDALVRMATRRSHRHFTSEPVPDAVLEPLLACAMSAPSKSDLQQACIVRVCARDLHDAIADLVPSMPWLRSAPVLLVVCGDNRRIRQICKLRDKPFGNDHLDSFFNAAVDAGIVLGSLVRAVEEAGLGCCPVSVIRNEAQRVATLLGLPEYVFPVAGLVVGHPARDVALSPRLPLALTVHRDRYDDAALASAVDDYDRRRDTVQPIDPTAQRRVELYGVAEPYGWSEDKARQVSVPERAGFGRFVRTQGFRLE